MGFNIIDYLNAGGFVAEMRPRKTLFDEAQANPPGTALILDEEVIAVTLKDGVVRKGEDGDVVVLKFGPGQKFREVRLTLADLRAIAALVSDQSNLRSE